MHQNTVIGIDLAKTSFAVIELGRGGDVKRRKTFRRDGLKRFLAKHEPTTVALEACGSFPLLGPLAGGPRSQSGFAATAACKRLFAGAEERL